MPIVIRRFGDADAEAAAALCAANSRAAVLDPSGEGFVQGTLTAGALIRMAADGGAFVAVNDGRIVGFVSSGWPPAPPVGEPPVGAPPPGAPPPVGEPPGQPPAPAPPVRRLIEVAPGLSFHGRTVGERPWICYGPVVVDAAVRGRGISRALLAAVRDRWRADADVAVLFIERANRHSTQVHIDGLGMEQIGGFVTGGRDYLVVAFAI